MMYQVPEEVPAPQIQTKFEQGEAYQQRYGLAFKMERKFNVFCALNDSASNLYYRQ
jgi:hypothetical protein